ncbi:MAG: glycosyltransferase family 4 protein [Minisyncoccia bacterium]
MRIVIATAFYPPRPGVHATYAAGIEESLLKLGHEVTVVSASRALPPVLSHAVYFLRLFHALRGASFVLALDTWSVGMPAYFAARLRGVPLALRIGGDFLWESYVARTGEAVRLSDFYISPCTLSLKERIIKRFTRMLLQTAHPLFTTHFQRDLWKRVYDIPDTRIRIVENHVPPKIGTYLPATGLVLVCSGRAIGLKNIDLLRRVVARLANDHPGLELDTRLMPHNEHQKRVAAAYAVIIPSFSEVCSNTAIDAVALGKPFVMTEDTGTKERFGACGLFLDTRSESALTHAIESILDPIMYEKLATNARELAFAHSWDDIAREIMDEMKK